VRIDPFPRRKSSAAEFHRPILTATVAGNRLVIVQVFSSHAVYTGDYSSPAPRITKVRRLNLEERFSFPRDWTPDRCSVNLESDRGMKNDLFRQSVESRFTETVLATPQDEVFAVLEPTGKWLLCTQWPSSIYAIHTEANPLGLMNRGWPEVGHLDRTFNQCLWRSVWPEGCRPWWAEHSQAAPPNVIDPVVETTRGETSGVLCAHKVSFTKVTGNISVSGYSAEYGYRER